MNSLEDTSTKILEIFLIIMLKILLIVISICYYLLFASRGDINCHKISIVIYDNLSEGDANAQEFEEGDNESDAIVLINSEREMVKSPDLVKRTSKQNIRQRMRAKRIKVVDEKTSHNPEKKPTLKKSHTISSNGNFSNFSSDIGSASELRSQNINSTQRNGEDQK